MKILSLSDTHGHRPKLQEADLLLHTGDWSSYGNKHETMQFWEWMKAERDKFKHVVGVPGNHDRWVASNQEEAKQLFASIGVTLLIDDVIMLDGKVIYGMPWTPTFGRWSYMGGPDLRKQKAEAIPDCVDVLATHGPPKGIMDEVQDVYSGTPRIINVGCEFLAERVAKIAPKIHQFGHIHEGYGTLDFGGTQYVNASVMDRWYSPVNDTRLLELE